MKRLNLGMKNRSAIAAMAFLALFGAYLAPAPTAAQNATSYECTLVIGYSQVRQWYTAGGAFESLVDDGRWELKAPNGAGVNVWANPEHPSWDAEIASPCTSRPPLEPDRVVFGISGPFGEDEKAWADTITEALALIRARFPSAESFVLIAVAGGPEHGDCTSGGRRVRASWQHKHVDRAIETVIGNDTTGSIRAGPSPHVGDCAGYSDFLGHLTDAEAELLGREIAAYFVELDGR